MIDRRAVGSVDLNRIVTTQPHAGELLIRKMLHHFQQPGIGAKKVLPEIRTALDEIFLILAVRDLAHAPEEQTVAIVLDDLVPIATPDHLDDVPSGTAEDRFQFLNDLAIAADRPVETLQIAVDDENQVVETFPRAERN